MRTKFSLIWRFRESEVYDNFLSSHHTWKRDKKKLRVDSGSTEQDFCFYSVHNTSLHLTSYFILWCLLLRLNNKCTMYYNVCRYKRWDFKKWNVFAFFLFFRKNKNHFPSPVITVTSSSSSSHCWMLMLQKKKNLKQKNLILNKTSFCVSFFWYSWTSIFVCCVIIIILILIVLFNFFFLFHFLFPDIFCFLLIILVFFFIFVIFRI